MSPRSLAIAVLVRSYPTVSETFIRDQIEGLRDAGHRVDVFSLYRGHTADEPGRTIEGETRYIIGPKRTLPKRLIRSAGRLLRGLRTPVRLFWLVRAGFSQPSTAVEAVHALSVLGRGELEYDVIHAHFGPMGRLALLLRRSRLIRGGLITTFHGVDLTRYPAVHGPDLYQNLFSSGEAFTVNSAFLEERAVRLGAPPDRLHRLPVGVDVEGTLFRARHWKEGEPLRLLTVARLEEVKGIERGLRAVAMLVDAGLDVRYTVVGGGRLAGSLAAEADRLGIAEQTRFTGPLPSEQVFREYHRHQLFLLPGIETADGQVEAQGRVLVEAQATGMPVIASRIGGMPETVAAGAGRLVRAGDPRAIAEAVRELLDRSHEWARMGQQGRTHVSRHYDQGELLERLLDIYGMAIATSPRRADRR